MEEKRSEIVFLNWLPRDINHYSSLIVLFSFFPPSSPHAVKQVQLIYVDRDRAVV
jgi:hypothetical protein